MKSLASKILIGAVGLVLATAPLAASAQNWQGHDNRDRGSYQRNDDRGRDRGDDRSRSERNYRDDRYRNDRPVYRERYDDGYYGRAPGGFQGYYSNGNWYHNRRWNGGIWIYF
jgi:hypothetical protein